MNWLDVSIVLVIILLVARGWHAGLLRQVGFLGGFVGGLILDAALAPMAANYVSTEHSKTIFAIVVLFGTALILAGIGEFLGATAGRRLSPGHRLLDALNGAAGAAFGAVIGLAAVWLMVSFFIRSPLASLQTAMQRSSIVQVLDRDLPPTPNIVARFNRLIAPYDFPAVFSGLEPTPPPSVREPGAAAVDKAATAGRIATVKIQGHACGRVIEGSGFVADPNLVATNAHVVAGVDNPAVIDANGVHPATVVTCDPDLDFAVLRTSSLAGNPLPLDHSLAPRGTVGAALGYPGGQEFTASPAAIVQSQTAIGRNIYDSGLVKRQVYTIRADLHPGNSGGPLITPDGVVVGIIFARSVSDNNIGYALTSSEVLPGLSAAAHGPVVTGQRCVIG